ncbi:nitrogen fixation protein NifQ [soil metagenome]
MTTHAVLMSCTVDASEPAALALAGVLAAAFERHGRSLLPLPGLDANATRQVLARWFPGADTALGLDWEALAGADRTEPRADEIEEVISLLREHADLTAGSKEASDAVAWALACASLGDNHLWQDLELPSRSELSMLIGHWFPSLAARNTQNMKWKKFFYKQLCEREEIMICKAPTCGVCTDHAVCFGPEDAQASQVIAFH